MKKLSLIIVFVFAVAANINAQVSVIANKSVDESVDKAKIGNIYSLTTTKWADGSKIVVFDNSGDSKTAFYSGIGKDQMSIKKEWMKKQLTGEAKAPETIGSDDDIVKKVASTPGAVSFVKSSSVNGTVKVLFEIK